jgi:hypothetical protein
MTARGIVGVIMLGLVAWGALAVAHVGLEVVGKTTIRKSNPSGGSCVVTLHNRCTPWLQVG